MTRLVSFRTSRTFFQVQQLFEAVAYDWMVRMFAQSYMTVAKIVPPLVKILYFPLADPLLVLEAAVTNIRRYWKQ